MMKLEEFTKRDYSKISDEELEQAINERFDNLERLIDNSNKKIDDELRHTNTDTL